MRNFKKPHRQGGFIGIAILGVALAFGAAAIALKFMNQVRNEQRMNNDSYPLRVVAGALAQYAKANKSSLVSNKEIMYVNDQYAPSLNELVNLGFLSTSGINAVSAYGTGLTTKIVYPSPDGSVTGYVFTTSSLKDAKGNPDSKRACAIANEIGDAGLCSSIANPASIGNNATQFVVNPAQPARVGALIFVPK
ncbi:hypothetical protein ACHMW6_00295 (plasmid) [Pseudoduganella sp. UC29_106]|uniref:hypothetical protein n=1 Tax=Pseudoduganella sp. UC29_106 TaxID=3374553 RepID=UPI0037579ADA